MINLLYDAVQIATNHKQMGKLSPSDFNKLVNKNIFGLFTQVFSNSRKLHYRKMKFQDTPNYGDEAQYVKQAQEYYITEKAITFNDAKCTVANQVSDYFLFNSMYSNKANIDKVDLLQFNQIAKLPDFSTTSCTPICTLNNGIIKVSPSDIVNATLVYFRTPKQAKYTFDVVGEREVFNPSKADFQDVDIHPIMFEALYIEMLSDYGINLKDEFAIQGATLLKQEEQVNKQ